jgi:hypothetical protein
MTTTPQITGLRMMDVRVQVATQGGGMVEVEKINAGRYIISTQDGRRWEVTEACGHWHGAVA